MECDITLVLEPGEEIDVFIGVLELGKESIEKMREKVVSLLQQRGTDREVIDSMKQFYWSDITISRIYTENNLRVVHLFGGYSSRDTMEVLFRCGGAFGISRAHGYIGCEDDSEYFYKYVSGKIQKASCSPEHHVAEEIKKVYDWWHADLPGIDRRRIPDIDAAITEGEKYISRLPDRNNVPDSESELLDIDVPVNLDKAWCEIESDSIEDVVRRFRDEKIPAQISDLECLGGTTLKGEGKPHLGVCVWRLIKHQKCYYAVKMELSESAYMVHITPRATCLSPGQMLVAIYYALEFIDFDVWAY